MLILNQLLFVKFFFAFFEILLRFLRIYLKKRDWRNKNGQLGVGRFGGKTG